MLRADRAFCRQSPRWSPSSMMLSLCTVGGQAVRPRSTVAQPLANPADDPGDVGWLWPLSNLLSAQKGHKAGRLPLKGLTKGDFWLASPRQWRDRSELHKLLMGAVAHHSLCFTGDAPISGAAQAQSLLHFTAI